MIEQLLFTELNRCGTWKMW